MIITSSDILELTKENVKLDSKLNETIPKVKQLTLEKENLMKDNEILDKNLAKLKVIIENLKKEIEDLKNQIKDFQDLVKELSKGSDKYIREI